MMRWLTAILASLALVGCGTLAEESLDDAELSACCEQSLQLIDQMPGCCQSGIVGAGKLQGCCAMGLADATQEEARPPCCREGRALLERMSGCCKATILTGATSACCEQMPAALEG